MAASDSRVGPDLGEEGHRHSDDWQYAHLYAPGVLVPGSPMPAMRRFFRAGASGRPHPSEEAVDLVAFLQALGRSRRDIWSEFRRADPEIPAPPAASQALVERGKERYGEYCAACHGAAGDGRGAAAPLLLFLPRDFVAAQYRFRSDDTGDAPLDADLFRTITLGTGTGSAMPTFYWLTAADRWALVLRIKEFSPRLRGRALKAAARPSEDPAGWSEAERHATGAGPRVEEGRRLWLDLGCAQCHGGDARGLSREEAGASWADPLGVVVPVSGDLTHACGYRGGASPRAVDQALFGLGLVMPSYRDAVPRKADRQALREYVLALRDGLTPP